MHSAQFAMAADLVRVERRSLRCNSERWYIHPLNMLDWALL